jgi:hypothetical protein
MQNGETPISLAAQKKVALAYMELLIRAGGDVSKQTNVSFLCKI